MRIYVGTRELYIKRILEELLTHRVAEKLKPVVVQAAGSGGRGRERRPDMLVRELPAESLRVELVDQTTLLKIRHEGREHEGGAKDRCRQEVQQTSLRQSEPRQLGQELLRIGRDIVPWRAREVSDRFGHLLEESQSHRSPTGAAWPAYLAQFDQRLLFVDMERMELWREPSQSALRIAAKSNFARTKALLKDK